MISVNSFVQGQWIEPGPNGAEVLCAHNDQPIALVGNPGLDMAGALHYGRTVGAPALQRLTFHQRASMLKALAQYLTERKQELNALSHLTGATHKDNLIDVDGGIGTMFVYASKGKRELPDRHILTDGEVEVLSRDGSFLGQHVYTSIPGVAININAFNFPIWGMLEKLAPAFLAGMPVVVKPASVTAYVTQACVQMMLQSGLVPDGAVQFISGRTGDMLEHVTCQDVVSFTGSANTALQLRSHPAVLANATRFVAEQDSLNAAILGPDATPETAEFDLFVKEVQNEMTTKAGQKCTAVRRIIVPQNLTTAVTETLAKRLANVTFGDPSDPKTQMGSLVSRAQKNDVLERAALIGGEAELVFDGRDLDVPEAGSYVAPMLYHCLKPDTADQVHKTEAFGPVSTMIGYRDLDHATTLANRGGGSLVTSLFTADPETARQVVMSSGAWHGRIYINNATSAKAATGHGSPMPHMTHGGPGRAGGGEELGGIRAVTHHMQRTAIQGSPDMLTAVTRAYVPAAETHSQAAHPFTRSFTELRVGETLNTAPRTITLDDIEQFAHFTGDTFYAHMDHDAATRNPFFPGRVAHGYLLLSFAAGLFVEPNEGPVLANTGLDNLRFMQPVEPGDTIQVQLTVMDKKRRNDDYGEVRWHVVLTNQKAETVAEYQLLTMVAG